jgi:chemotaxis protein methyltransferase CheR
MTVVPTAAEIDRFRSAIGSRLGLRMEDARIADVRDLLLRRTDVAKLSSGPYLERLEAHAWAEEDGALAQELTVPETYFFRNIAQFEAVAEHVLPDRIRANADQKTVRGLSAGCASGEEAYSLAIVIGETLRDPSWQASVRAVDINAAMLSKARAAHYSAWSLRETPTDARRRWFRSDVSGVTLDVESLRVPVEFELRNLAHDNTDLWAPEVYDIIFCRNVLMYLTAATTEALVASITRSLAPGGFLFLGHAETLRGLSRDFHLHHTHGTFYYQRKQETDGASGHPMAGKEPASSARSPLPALVETAESWVDAIQKASERIELLTKESQSPVTGRATPHPVGSPSDLSSALELMTAERFVEALDLVESLPAATAIDPDVLLLRAALLAHSGSLEQAEGACHLLLATDELNVGAHYLLALCRDGLGDQDEAAEHDRMAIHLDPGFAMARVHLGLLARRAGDIDTARRELQRAAHLLGDEDAARLLLFGGGFQRAALIALCQSELRASGSSA